MTSTPLPVAWKINRERVLLLGWTAAILLQFAHPLVAVGVAEHSTAFNQPGTRLRRLRHTLDAMLALTFGTPEEALAAVQGINAIHDRVHGRVPCSSLAREIPYSAHDPALLRWVLATLLLILPRTYELYVGPLTPDEKSAFCIEASEFATRLGIPEDDLLANEAELLTYLDEMLGGGEISVSDTARGLARELLYPEVPRFALPVLWLARLPAVGLLPPEIRDAFGLRWDSRNETALQLSAWLVRHLLPMTPSILRYWPAARTAMCRGAVSQPTHRQSAREAGA